MKPAADARKHRLTRAESRAQTRERLLTAARRVMVEVGLGGATLDLIADQAGYTKGAVYSNFSSKEQILIELMQLHMRAELAALSEILQQAASLEDLTQRLTDLYAAMHQDPGVVVLSLEFQLLATRREEVRESYVGIWHDHRATLATLLSDVAQRFQVSLLMPAADLINAVAAMTHGLVLQDAIGRPNDSRAAASLMIGFLRSQMVPTPPVAQANGKRTSASRKRPRQSP
jgi:AcrR family transcriptional regulator